MTVSQITIGSNVYKLLQGPVIFRKDGRVPGSSQESGRLSTSKARDLVPKADAWVPMGINSLWWMSE